MSLLTRDEAQTRSQLLDVQRYAVDLDLTTGDTTFASRTRVHFTARAAGDTFIDLNPARLHTATLDGTPLDPATLDGHRLPLTGLTPGPHELTVEADMAYSRTGEGMHRFTDPADDETYLYTQLFLDDARRVFAAFDQPDLKAHFDLTVTAPPHWTVLANGTTTPHGDGRWTATTTPLISPYLVAVAAGPWHTVRTDHRGLPFGIHCRRSLAPHLDADATELLSTTTALFDRYHEKFDEPYPFDSYDQAFVPEFNAGAMENPGLVTFRDTYVFRSAVTDAERCSRAVTIAHEMAHMWFGDLVTLTWWDDIWLNESFAEYMGYQTVAEATPWTHVWTDFAAGRKDWGYDADQRPTTHPVAPDPDAVPDTASALLNFDGISYAKGAAALRQLTAWLGEKDFLAGINRHFTRHRFANATLADFLDNLASATDRDVHSWAAAWLRTSGVDTLTAHATDTGTPAAPTWQLTVDRDGTRPHRITVTTWDHTPDGPPARRDRLDLDLPQDRPLTLPGHRPDLVVLNDQDLTYAKLRLDPTSWTTAQATLATLPDPLTRAVLWNTARDLVRDGHLDPAAYLDAARTHLPHETDLAVTTGVLGFASRHVAGVYTHPDDRPAALATLTALCRDLLRRTEGLSTEDWTRGQGGAHRTDAHPGLRLVAVRHFIDSATQPATLTAWLDDGLVPGGPTLDPALRWRILGRLAVLGAVDEAAIDAELTADPSATGQEGAARCRAALPDLDAKRRAWEAMFEDDTLSTYLFTATAQGFWQPEQTALVRPYIHRYYREAPGLARRRGAALATAAGAAAFPAYAVDDEALTLGRAALAQDGLVPALRRRLADQLDDLARALRVRDRQAGATTG
ncbi:aminopeptidase N [Streptomyces albidoflavus]|uniref:aminopeptidase N n=1 Tax=Streptomyces albidoflavus TaxID=1886 RepID=UPI0033F9C1BA